MGEGNEAMKITMIESPFRGRGDSEIMRTADAAANRAYAYRALHHSLQIGEAPFASHILYPLVLNDNIPEQRTLGMRAGFEFLKCMEQYAFYTDRGWSDGMIDALEKAALHKKEIVLRSFEGAALYPPLTTFEPEEWDYLAQVVRFEYVRSSST